MQYTQDYDELMPLKEIVAGCNGGTGGATAAGSQSWRSLIQPYIKSKQVFACPSNTLNGTNSVYDQDAKVGPIPLSYSNNTNAIYGSTNGGGTDCSYRPSLNGVIQPPLNQSQIEASSQFILITENTEGGIDIAFARTPAQFATKKSGLFAGHFGARIICSLMGTPNS